MYDDDEPPRPPVEPAPEPASPDPRDSAAALPAARYNITLDAVDRLVSQAERDFETYQPPSEWTPEHVDVRMTEAFEILMRLPMTTRPKRFGNSMPRYAYEMADLVAQSETGELERTYKRLNRSRGGATAVEIARMEEALAWPLRFLNSESAVAKATSWASYRKAVNLDDRFLHRALGVSRRTFFRYRLRGLTVIAHQLNLLRTPVT